MMKMTHIKKLVLIKIQKIGDPKVAISAFNKLSTMKLLEIIKR